MYHQIQNLLSKAPSRTLLPISNPLLTAVLPITFLMSHNIGQFDLTPTLILSGVVLCGALILTGIIGLITRDLPKASLISTIWIALFFGYAAVLELVSSFEIFGFHIGRQRYLLVLISAIAIWSLLTIARSQGVREDLTKLLTAVFGALTIFNLVMLTVNSNHSVDISHPERTMFEKNLAAMDLPTIQADVLPDIYYIILDSYPRADVLSEFYQYDNSRFLNALHARGFFVGENSKSNYVQSVFSLSSSLNMQYLDQYITDVNLQSDDESVMLPLIESNGAYYITKELGYRFAFIPSYAFGFTENRNSNVHLTPSSYPLKKIGKYIIEPVFGNQFGAALVRTSALRGVMDRWLGTTWPRLFNQQIEHLKSIPNVEDPVFAFAHIYQPQMPYVFDRFGNTLNLPFSDLTIDKAREGWADTERYVDQLIHVNNSMLDVVDTILENSDRESVIIIQGDHGTASSPDRNNLYFQGDPSTELIKERTAILNAIRLAPSCDKNALYHSLSPVNLFRLIFDSCLSTSFGLKTDDTYWHSYDRPFDFTLINELPNYSPN